MCVQSGKCQCSNIDNQTVSSVKESEKSVVTDSGHKLQEISTKDSTLTKENIIMTSMNSLCWLKDAIFENGIKYILCLLCFSLYDTMFSMFFGCKKHIETKHAEPCNKNRKKQNRRKQIDQKRKRQGMGNYYSNGKPLRTPQNTEKDSDPSKNQSSNNVTAVNMPLNRKNSCISRNALKKRTDISTEKHSFKKIQFTINISHDNEPFANERSNGIRNKYPKFYTQRQRNNFSVNEGNAEIFCQTCTSDNKHPSSSFPKSSASYRYRKSKQTNFFYNGENSKCSNNSVIKSYLKKNKTEQKKKLSVRFAPTNEKEKLTFDTEKNEKHTEQRNKMETQEKRSFKRHDPTKYKSHYLRIPVRNKESKQNNLKYKETGTQTDSTFSTYKNIEMVSVGTMCPEQQSCEYVTRECQDRDTNQELTNDECEAKNELDKKILLLAHSLISLPHVFPPPTNLTFDESIVEPPDTNIAAEIWPTEVSNSINTFNQPIRSPPGFPKYPQHRPLRTDTYNPEHLMRPSTHVYQPNSHTKPMVIPPVPPRPIGRLHDDYPKFV